MELFLIIIISLFSILLFGIGFYHRNNRTSESYYMNNRKIDYKRIGASVFTLFGAGEIVTLTALAYLFGFYTISLFLGFIAGLLIMSLIIKKIRKNSEKYFPHSNTDFIRYYVGKKSEKVSLLLSILAVFSLYLIQLIVGGLLISYLTGLSHPVSVSIIAIVVLGYILLGGLNSVLTTDLIQAFGIGLFLLILALFYNPTQLSVTQILNIDNSSISFLDFFSLFVSGTLVVLGSTDIYQRIFAAKDNNEAKKGMYASAFLWSIFGFLMVFLGLVIYANFPNADPSLAFFSFLDSNLSLFLSSIVSLLLIASIFSSADTELFLLSILSAKVLSKRQQISKRFSLVMLPIVTVIGILLAIHVESLVDIYFILLYAFMIVSPVILLRLMNRGTDEIFSLGMFTSIILGIFLFYNGLFISWYPLLLIIPPSLGIFVKSSGKEF